MLASVLATDVLSDVVLLPWLWAEDEVSVARVMACIPRVLTRIAKYFTAAIVTVPTLFTLQLHDNGASAPAEMDLESIETLCLV